MFDQMKQMGAIASLLKNKDKLAEAAARVKRALEDRPVTAESGGGAVRVTIGSEMKVLRIEIAPAVAAGIGAGDDARQQIETLIADATNDAMQLAQQRLKEAIDREATELGFEGFGDQIGGFLR
ncbi:MAG: YbaB/EbfC family nucleoid-associated protein [Planctomycetota bacterium]|nr:YbaB/EbfC family nucleoid-associated protein [Planctomycetota bacterium]